MAYSRVLTLVMAFLLVLTAVCAPPADAAEKKFIMRVGAVTVPPHPQSVVLNEMKKLIEERAGDRIEVQVYHAGQLGTVQQHLQGLQNGSIQCASLPTGFLSALVPVLNIVDLPFLFPSSDWIFAALRAGYTEPLYDAMLAKGLIVATPVVPPNREIFVSKPISTLEDFKGARIRTYNSPLNQQAIAAFGMTPVNIDTGEVAVAIQQGTIDGIETDIALWYALKLTKAHYRITGYKGGSIMLLSFGKRWMDTLPPDLQKIIMDASWEAALKAEAVLKETVIPNILNDPSIKIVDVPTPPEVVQTMRENSLKVHDTYKNMGAEERKAYEYYKPLVDQYPNGNMPPRR